MHPIPNPLRQLAALGQSVWLDFIRRDDLSPHGRIARLIAEDDLRGVTSNPAIFEKAINGSPAYDADILALRSEGRTTGEILEALILKDVAQAADLFRPVYEATGGSDGFVSIEVSPKLALDSSGSMAEARRFWTALSRPNVMVKLPGTSAGVPAIRRLLAEGVNVNITLLFSVQRYLEVHEAYLAALEERIREGRPIDRLSSVASFFVSRIDTVLDSRLAEIGRTEGPRGEKARGLLGTLAIANAKVAYQEWLKIVESPRWKDLAAKGARPQRLLWASTSTKNPAYSDILYVEPLVGPGAINTMPLETLEAYRDHGRPAPRIGEGVAEAQGRLATLGELGLDLGRVTLELEREGVRKFVEPLDKLLGSLEKKQARVSAAQPSMRRSGDSGHQTRDR
jgi:transaldolase